ncbi:MAG: DUF4956 domain-containing protein [Saprospiraceae bacterium]
MVDFFSIQNSTENPTLLLIIYTVLFSFLLSSLIAFTYEKTSREVAKPIYFIQALVLLAIVTATVMQAIGDSVARGLGMLGALSVIRFRTTLRNPRNIVFMFSSLSVGIACGVYGFLIAIVGTVGFCFTAFVLRFTPFSQKNNLVGNLKFEMPEDEKKSKEIKKILKKYAERFALKRYKTFNNPEKENIIEYEYRLKLKQEDEGLHLAKILRQIPEVNSVRLSFDDVVEII